MSVFSSEAQSYYNAIGDAELQAIDLVAGKLALAEVDVTIAHCDYMPLNTLPAELRLPLAMADEPATEVRSMDMKLAYNRSEKLFHLNDMLMRFNSGATMSFNRMAQIMIAPSTRERMYDTQLRTINQQSLLRGDDSLTVQESFVNELMAKLGVTLLANPHQANWDALYTILRSSNRWSAVASTTVPLREGQHVYIEERYDGRGYTGDSDIDTVPTNLAVQIPHLIEQPFTNDRELSQDDTEMTEGLDDHITEITIAVDNVTRNFGEYASLKYTLISHDPANQPRTAGFQRVKVNYKPDRFGARMIREEQPETARLVLPKLETVRYLSRIMVAAQTA